MDWQKARAPVCGSLRVRYRSVGRSSRAQLAPLAEGKAAEPSIGEPRDCGTSSSLRAAESPRSHGRRSPCPRTGSPTCRRVECRRDAAPALGHDERKASRDIPALVLRRSANLGVARAARERCRSTARVDPCPRCQEPRLAIAAVRAVRDPRARHVMPLSWTMAVPRPHTGTPNDACQRFGSDPQLCAGSWNHPAGASALAVSCIRHAPARAQDGPAVDSSPARRQPPSCTPRPSNTSLVSHERERTCAGVAHRDVNSGVRGGLAMSTKVKACDR